MSGGKNYQQLPKLYMTETKRYKSKRWQGRKKTIWRWWTGQITKTAMILARMVSKRQMDVRMLKYHANFRRTLATGGRAASSLAASRF